MHFDPVLLSRIQFAWVIAWHILLPAFTVGLASYIAVLEALSFTTGRQVYLRLSTFWIRIFAISFGKRFCATPRSASSMIATTLLLECRSIPPYIIFASSRLKVIRSANSLCSTTLAVAKAG